MGSDLKLAITTIGDLLLNDFISEDKAGNQIVEIKLEIPNYQRPYKWTAKNAIQLLNDIVDAKNRNNEIYRVGTLILHKDNDKYNIVDGQQRIITFSLLLNALGADQIKFLEQKLSHNPFTIRNIQNNYLTLKRQVNNIGGDQDKNDLLEYIKNNCELIVVITDDLSEAFQFFDSQNARGKKLYPHDLLKAYHLREMNHLEVSEIESVVKSWENVDQKKLSELFSEYLHRVREWTNGNKALELTEHNIQNFKGITRQNNYPYAQFYKGAFYYAETVNHSAVPKVTGIKNLKKFQLYTPIFAGKPFFDYALHYFTILCDIQNNNKYEGYYINDNEIVATLNLLKYRTGIGNQISRLLFDTAILLYVDRFCPEHPNKKDTELLEKFVVLAFVWAYSLRAQYHNLGWASAQNYILGNNDKKNSFNIYKIITQADSPASLLIDLSDILVPILDDDIPKKLQNLKLEECDSDNIFKYYLYFFSKYNFYEQKK
ncbi:MAG: DUF262 domain-containing protein [Deltaproteobacteria bacterium]|jgi:hypothetical protein|nr:DUF262 domain-containing protein [Deltaproteobacteria bacterium]